MTKVIPQSALVTRYDGEALSLARGQEYDLPEDLAERLTVAGLVVAVEPEPDPEAERIAAEKAAAAKKAAAAPKKGAESSKKLDGAPENK